MDANLDHEDLLALELSSFRIVDWGLLAMIELERIKGCLVGLACGDAVGTTVEFRQRGTFDPVTDMTGGGPYDLKKGQWTDDTSLALCLAASLIECRGFDANDQMQRYLQWWEGGYMSSIGKCFDIGITCSAALRQFKTTGEPYSGIGDEYSAGNGSLMRLAPIPIAYRNNTDDLVKFAELSSKTTHGDKRCIDCCRLFATQIQCALLGGSKEEILRINVPVADSVVPEVQPIASGAYLSKRLEEMTGSGYVVESLESALWCFANGDSFRESILLATNLEICARSTTIDTMYPYIRHTVNKVQ